MNIKQNLEGKVYENGYNIIKSKGAAIIGMSPGNSYFKEGTIKKLIDYCSETFTAIYVMIPSAPSIYNYRAIGYDYKDAKEKSRLKSNNLKHHTERAIGDRENVKIIDWDHDISKHYAKELKDIYALYKTNAQFRTDCRNTTAKVLENKLKPRIDLEKAIDKGVNYLLKEFAGMSAIPKLFNKEQVAYIYHHEWPVYENYVNGVYGKERNDLGLVIII